MLYSVGGKAANDMPHEEEFQAWRAQISDAEYQAMVDAVNAYCDGKQTFCTSWMPGTDKAIAAAFPPLTRACGGNIEASGLFFGNIVWRAIVDRDDDWHFLPAEERDGKWIGVTYFRPDR